MNSLQSKKLKPGLHLVRPIAILMIISFGLSLSACKRGGLFERPAKPGDCTNWWDCPEKIPEEDLDDPEIYKTPRLQFVWLRGPTYDQSKKTTTSIWSMALDGSQLRRVSSKEVLFSNDVGVINDETPLRSPNNRYLLISAGLYSTGATLLIDLKTKSSRVLQVAGAGSGFAWTSDSRYAFTAGYDGKICQHDVTTSKQEKLPIETYKLWLVNDDTRFLAYDQLMFIDRFSGKVFRKIEVEKIEHLSDAWGSTASPDGRLFWYAIKEKSFIINLDNPEKPIYSGSVPIARIPVFGPDGKELYYIDRLKGELAKLDLSTGKKQLLGVRFPRICDNLTIYNVRKPETK